MLATTRGRTALAWYVDSGIAETVRATGALPQVAWAQDGEDLYLDEYLPATGSYVDVGAHHPDRFSVTRKLYDKGWRGVNIDVAPGFVDDFARRRPEDITVRSLVGEPGEVTFVHFVEPALSTLDVERADRLKGEGWAVASIEQLPVRTLTDLLDGVAFDGPIDLLSIDVEGHDEAVLRSLDWDRWHVERCLVEVPEPAYSLAAHPIAVLLAEKGLRPSRVWGRSCLFER